MSVRENMQDLIRQANECVELLDAGDLTEVERGRISTVIRDLAGVINNNLKLIADAHGG